MGGERIQNAPRVKRLRFNCHQPKPRGVLMGTLMPATPTQTLYVSVRRDELRKLKDERDQLRQQVAQLHMMLEQARSGDKAINL
ncbi:hypothetical protein D3C76_1083530 [compost metagenome]